MSLVAYRSTSGGVTLIRRSAIRLTICDFFQNHAGYRSFWATTLLRSRHWPTPSSTLRSMGSGRSLNVTISIPTGKEVHALFGLLGCPKSSGAKVQGVAVIRGRISNSLCRVLVEQGSAQGFASGADSATRSAEGEKEQVRHFKRARNSRSLIEITELGATSDPIEGFPEHTSAAREASSSERWPLSCLSLLAVRAPH